LSVKEIERVGERRSRVGPRTYRKREKIISQFLQSKKGRWAYL